MMLTQTPFAAAAQLRRNNVTDSIAVGKRTNSTAHYQTTKSNQPVHAL